MEKSTQTVYRIPKGFELIIREQEETEITIIDRNKFLHWDNIFPFIDEKIVKVILHHPEGGDNQNLEIYSPKFLHEQVTKEILALKFDISKVKKNDFEIFLSNDMFQLRKVFSVILNDRIIYFPKRLLKSIVF